MKSDAKMNLTGQFLIALPSMQDPRFERAVIYICSHNSDGAMGLIINKHKGDAHISDLLGQIGIEGAIKVADTPVLDGGPVDIDRGFVLHTADYYYPDRSLRLSETLCLTSTKDVLEALTTPEAPDLAVLAIGYSGWSGGQLEREIQQNSWMVAPANEALIFDPAIDDKWTTAVKSLGITPEMLSATGGRA